MRFERYLLYCEKFRVFVCFFGVLFVGLRLGFEGVNVDEKFVKVVFVELFELVEKV